MRYKKKHLNTRFSIDSGIKRDPAREITNAFLYSFRAFLSEMKVGDRLEIRDFGVFEMHLAKGRTTGRNPRKNEWAVIPAKRRLRFKPSSTLKREFKKVI